MAEPTPWPTLAWLAVFFLIGVYAIRGVAWWPLGAVAAIAGVLVTGPVVDPARPEALGSPLMRRLNLVVAGAIVARRRSPCCRSGDRSNRVSTRRPASSATRRPGSPSALRATAGPSDRLFNPQPWGSWFEFALPDLPVAIDSRIELFPAATWDTYENIVAGGEDWAAQLDDWGVTMIVVGAKETAMADRLTAAGWRRDLRGRRTARSSSPRTDRIGKPPVWRPHLGPRSRSWRSATQVDDREARAGTRPRECRGGDRAAQIAA